MRTRMKRLLYIGNKKNFVIPAGRLEKAYDFSEGFCDMPSKDAEYLFNLGPNCTFAYGEIPEKPTKKAPKAPVEKTPAPATKDPINLEKTK